MQNPAQRSKDDTTLRRMVERLAADSRRMSGTATDLVRQGEGLEHTFDPQYPKPETERRFWNDKAALENFGDRLAELASQVSVTTRRVEGLLPIVRLRVTESFLDPEAEAALPAPRKPSIKEARSLVAGLPFPTCTWCSTGDHCAQPAPYAMPVSAYGGTLNGWMNRRDRADLLAFVGKHEGLSAGNPDALGLWFACAATFCRAVWDYTGIPVLDTDGGFIESVLADA